LSVSYNNLVIFTSDNPRDEDPEIILDEMIAGVEEIELNEEDFKWLRITDRRQAIKTACLMAKANDIILIAGKGHEKYQEIKGERFPFDDKKIVMECFN